MSSKIKHVLLLALITVLISGCGARKEGKIYFMSNRFSGNLAKENTGTCVYENGKVTSLFRYYRDPGVSKDGKKLVAQLKNKRRTVAVVDIELDEVKEYHLSNGSAVKYEWFPTSNSKFVYVGAEYEGEGRPRGLEDYIWNLYSFDVETQKIHKITSYSEKGRRIPSFSISPDGAKIVYCIALGSKTDDGRTVKIINLKTKKEKEMPFSAGTVAWSPEGDTISLVGVETRNRKIIKYGLEIVLYDIKTQKFKKLGNPGGKDSYQWESDLTYSPDGKKIAFIRHENSGKKTLWTMNADGTNRKLILNDGYYKSHLSWTK